MLMNPLLDATEDDIAFGSLDHSLLTQLIENECLSVENASRAMTIARQTRAPMIDVLFNEFGISRLTISQTYAMLLQCQFINPCQHPPDRKYLQALGVNNALKLGLLPWRRMANATVVLTEQPSQFEQHKTVLEQSLGPVRMAMSTREQMQASITRVHHRRLAQTAELKTPDDLSCRRWSQRKTALIGTAFFAIMFIAAMINPRAVFNMISLFAITTLVLASVLKFMAVFAGLKPIPQAKHATGNAGATPKITVMVPLFRETNVTDHLLARLKALQYPRARLEICLVVESDDTLTRATVGRATLPAWMKTVVVPQGALRTKPRALNYALDFTSGDIIGIYDAEDAPDTDQLLKVAARFARSSQKVACLQGTLDFYNDKKNWLTRCFTIEYATWFRVVLPGLARLGLVVPLGGTTLFFRRNVLEELGGWDAHNVTEDADLGVRLARFGYRTELINTVTQEEANGRFWPWVKQRSRWLKGYAVTYAVHMRDPRRLLRDLGYKKFIGFQILFAGTLSQFLLAPLLWSFWMVPLGLPHPLIDVLSPAVYWPLAGLMLGAEGVSLWANWLGLKRAQKTWLFKWAFTLQFYFPLAVAATYKGLAQLAWKPFYWDKTMHGVLMPTEHDS